MRNVYCKTDSVADSKACAKAMHMRFLKMGYDSKLIGENKIEIHCKGYDIKFLDERQWLTYTTTKVGTGYLTIPYNRILISPFGVPQEDCKLNKLIQLVKEGY